MEYILIAFLTGTVLLSSFLVIVFLFVKGCEATNENESKLNESKLKEFEFVLKSCLDTRFNFCVEQVVSFLRGPLYLHSALRSDTKLYLKCEQVNNYQAAIEIVARSAEKTTSIVTYVISIVNFGSLLSIKTSINGKEISTDDLLNEITKKIVYHHNMGNL